MRIRILALPTDGEFDEFDLRYFRPGDVYDVPTQLASLLMIAGYAEMASGGDRLAEAADVGQVPFPKSRRRRLA